MKGVSRLDLAREHVILTEFFRHTQRVAAPLS